jgi:hypothetical protein
MQVSPTLSPGYCLASCGTPGCNMTLAPCSSDDTQRWLFGYEDRMVPLSHPRLCLEFSSPGGVVTLDTCNYSAEQRWDVTTGVCEVIGPSRTMIERCHMCATHAWYCMLPLLQGTCAGTQQSFHQ